MFRASAAARYGAAAVNHRSIPKRLRIVPSPRLRMLGGYRWLIWNLSLPIQAGPGIDMGRAQPAPPQTRGYRSLDRRFLRALVARSNKPTRGAPRGKHRASRRRTWATQFVAKE